MEDSDLKSGRAPDRGRSPSEPGGEEVGDEEVKERRAELQESFGTPKQGKRVQRAELSDSEDEHRATEMKWKYASLA